MFTDKRRIWRKPGKSEQISNSLTKSVPVKVIYSLQIFMSYLKGQRVLTQFLPVLHGNSTY